MQTNVFLRTMIAFLPFLTLTHQNSEATIYEISPRDTIKIEDSSSSSSCSNISEKHSLYETIENFAPLEMNWKFFLDLKRDKKINYKSYTYTIDEEQLKNMPSSYAITSNPQFVKAIYNDDSSFMELAYQYTNTFLSWVPYTNSITQIVVKIEFNPAYPYPEFEKIKFLIGNKGDYLDKISEDLKNHVKIYLSKMESLALQLREGNVLTDELTLGLQKKIQAAFSSFTLYIDQIKDRHPDEILNKHTSIKTALDKEFRFLAELLARESGQTRNESDVLDSHNPKPASLDTESFEDSNCLSQCETHEEINRALTKFVEKMGIRLAKTPQEASPKKSSKEAYSNVQAEKSAQMNTPEGKRAKEILKNFLNLKEIDSYLDAIKD
jgi:hypothetical protein